MSYIVPLVVLLFGTSMLSIIFKKKFEIVLPLFFMLGALVIYAFTIFSMFNVGCILFLLLSIIFPIYCIYLFVKNRKSFKEKMGHVVTPGFFLFVLLYTFIYILNINRNFTTWDEFSHWGIMVKETLRLHNFYNVSGSILRVHPDYPPIVTLLESAWCMLCGDYKESFLYIALQTFGMSLMFPFLSNLKFENSLRFVIKLFLIFLCLIAVPLLVVVGEANFYSTIYIDAILGLLIGYGFALVLIEKKYDRFVLFNLSMLFSFIILTKQIAIFFVMLIIFDFVLNVVSKNKINISVIKKNYRVILWAVILLLIVPISLNLTWSLIVKSHDIIGQFNLSNINLLKLFGIYKGVSGEAYQHQTIINYLNTILYEGKFITLRLVDFTYLQCFLLVSSFIILLRIYSKKVISTTRFDTFHLTVWLGAISYAFILMVLYVFCFDSYEAPRLASLYRYINTYVSACVAAIVMVYLYVDLLKNKCKISHFALCVIFVYLFWLNSDAVKNLIPAKRGTSSTDFLQSDVENIRKYASEENTYIIAQNTNGYCTFLIQYLISPTKVNLENYSLGDKYNDNDVWTKDVPADDWFESLKDYKYLYFYSVDDNFKDKYGQYFDKIENKKMYKIDFKNKKIDLID